MGYNDLLKDPRWQRKRLEIFSRDEWKCQKCGDTKTELHIHHKEYVDFILPWEYEGDQLITYCKICHESAHDETSEEEIEEQKIHKIESSRHYYEKYKEELNLGPFEEVHPWLFKKTK